MRDFLFSGKSPISLSALLGILVALSLVTACATLPENVDRKETFAYPHTGDTFLGRTFSRQAAEHPGEFGFRLLGNGLDAFVARAVLARLAEQSIDVQYYLYHNDLVGRLLTWQLLPAADRGVRVRLLVDDMDLSGRDRGQVFIGSMNLDPRSMIHNTEIGVVVTSLEIAQEMGEWFDRNVGKIAFRLELKKEENGSETLLWHGLVDGGPQTFTADPYTGFWKRFGIGFLGVLPIESQL